MAENNQLLQGVSNAAFSLGKSLPKRKMQRDTSQFNGLINDVRKSSATSDTFSNLGPVTVPYGGSTKYEKSHPGIDIAGPIGKKLNPFAGGTVTDIRTGQVQDASKPSFGNYVIIKDSQGNSHRYSHLSKSFVKVGQQVTPQDVIGEFGNTGSTYSQSGGTGSHLDFRIKNAYGKYIDPSIYLKSL